MAEFNTPDGQKVFINKGDINQIVPYATLRSEIVLENGNRVLIQEEWDDALYIINKSNYPVVKSLTRGIIPNVTAAVTSINRLLSSASVLGISTGATITGEGVVSLETGLATGASSTFIINEVDGQIELKYPLTLIGTEVAVALGDLTLSFSSATAGSPLTINILGATAGSTITGAVPDGMALSSSARTISGTPTTAGSYSFGLTETLVGATGSPRTTMVAITVSASAQAIPSTQTIAFGSKTRVGHGGHPLGYTGTGALTIVGGNGLGHWQIDSRNHLVPRNNTGAYGSAPPPFAGPYMLTVSDGTLNSSVTVNILANAAHVRAVPTGSNADFSYGSVPSRGHQLGVLLPIAAGLSGALVLGDTVWCRTSVFNAAAVVATFRPAAGLWAAGSGSRITIRSEEPDTALDAAGEPRREHGFVIGRIALDPATGGNVEYPIDFVDVQFATNMTTATTGGLFGYTNTTGWGVGASNCLFALGSDVPQPYRIDGFSGHRPATVTNCRFRNLDKGATGVNIFTFNHGEDLWEDFVGVSGSGNVIEDNFVHRWQATAESAAALLHADAFQHLGNKTGALMNLGSFRRNIAVRDGGQLGYPGHQGIFCDDSIAGDANMATIQNNIVITAGSLHGIYLNRFVNPTVSLNTVLTDFAADAGGSTITASINVPADKPGSGGDFTRNAVNVLNLSGQSGYDSSNSVTLGKTTGEMAGAFAAPSFTGLASRAAVRAAWRPKLNGTLKRPDGSYAGALKPDGSWNDGAPFAG